MGDLTNNRPRLNNPSDLFKYYGVAKTDLTKYTKQIKAGRLEAAMNAFHKKYVGPYVADFQATMQGYLYEAQIGEMSAAKTEKIQRNIGIYASRVQRTVNNNFKIFVEKSFAPSVFEKTALKNRKLKRAILDDTLKEFTKLTNNSMSNTATSTLANTRKMQRQMIVRNHVLQQSGSTPSALEEARFRSTLRKTTMPDYYRAMEEGSVYKSRPFGSSGNQVINYRLDAYNEMATKTTLMNMDRTANETKARVDGSNVVEYFLEDPRTVKNDREVCQDILTTMVAGRSLLALDAGTAAALNIMTIDAARANYAMAPNCRHSIRPVSSTFQAKINQVIGR